MAGISGLGSGIDVASLVQQLVAADRAPATRWNTQRLAALSQQTAWSDLSTKLTAVRTAAEALDTGRKASPSSATTSDAKVMTPSADRRGDVDDLHQGRQPGDQPAAHERGPDRPLDAGRRGHQRPHLGPRGDGHDRAQAPMPGCPPAATPCRCARPAGPATGLQGDADPSSTSGRRICQLHRQRRHSRTVNLPRKVYASTVRGRQGPRDGAASRGRRPWTHRAGRRRCAEVTSTDTGSAARLSIDATGVASRLGLAGARSSGVGATASLDGGTGSS